MKTNLLVIRELLDCIANNSFNHNKLLIKALGVSSLVYFDDEFIDKQIARFGYTHTIITKDKMKCLIMETPETIYIGFRATEDAHKINIKRLMNFWPKKIGNMKIHGGIADLYLEYAEFLKDYLMSILHTDKKVIFTGHSIGAAIATLFKINYDGPALTINFASPNIVFNDNTVTANIISYRILKDPITWLPLSLPFLRWYRASGTIKLNPVKKRTMSDYHNLDNYIEPLMKPFIIY